MIREEVRFLGCGFNKAKYAGKMKYCIEHGLDFGIYKLGPRRIKKMIQRKFGIELEILKLERTKGYGESLSVKLGVSYGN